MSAEIPNGHAEDQSLETETQLQTPGAGPSRLPAVEQGDEEQMDEEERDRVSFFKKQAEYLELEQSVNSSTELLSSLASYLSTFQNDLSAVSGQISDLQGRSSEIDSQLKGRKTILPPLNALLTDITLPPSLVLTLRDTLPSQNPEMWLSAITQLDSKLQLLSSRSSKVKAVQELAPIIEGLKLKALNVLPSFLLSLIKPLKSASKGLSTNLAVLQTSLLLKYQPFYQFLLRNSPKIAKQVERGYVTAARSYYETGFRRYARSLGTVKSRITEKQELVGSLNTSDAAQNLLNGQKHGGGEKEEDRLRFKDLDVEGEDAGVILGYMADEKDFKAPVEALFRSLALVLLDNASSEFTFIVRFFAKPSSSATAAPTGIRSPIETPVESSPNPSFVDLMSDTGRSTSTRQRKGVNEINENLKDAERIWHEVFDSSLEYTTTFFNSIISPGTSAGIPSVISLLTIIRLNDNLINCSDSRGCIPLITYLNSWKLNLWPVFRKEMDHHINSLKSLADDLEGKNLISSFGLGLKSLKDNHVRQIAKRYGEMFSRTVALSNAAEEVMIFSSMTRLRTELIRILTSQSNKIKSVPERHSFLSSIYEIIMHELVSGPGQTTHPKLQSELSYFRTREEEARRRIAA
ncbi:hypothetical protein I302_107572 [Kwoniella bestiolae CBS 10118]|uniref:Vacuolar protein sorting-associated protein 52 n=1 Tax=Kwoniella bestiolae CBS 10118 TaxID=1296100 RepID=A0A1B9FY66_9TREE|nr:hypothetical protein I302_06688 [Kwoniella bestiolae CBS 10118]OCF23705.1 hypothetical protein I302_06688 [Kwoniella bestiolae CBS 10118]